MRIPIVNEQDEVIGYKERSDRAPTDIVRVTSVWITNEKDEILLAQRSFQKEYHAGLWGPAVAGTVEEGETYESNAVKEAEEEIGLVGVELLKEHKIPYSTTLSCIVQCFSAKIHSSYPLVKQDTEVEAIRWISKEEFLRELEAKPEMFLPNLRKSSSLYIHHENKN